MTSTTFAEACREADKRKKAAEKARTNGEARPVLIIDPGELPQVAEKLRDILAASGAFFDRGVPVRIATPAGGLPIATPLTNHGVVRAAHQFCRPMKDGMNATLPERVAGLYLDMTGEWRLPRLIGISTSPLLSDDGSIHIATGYDPKSGLYCCNVPELVLPEQPTKEQAAAALATLRFAFRTFPFADAERQFDAALGVDVVDLEKPIGLDESGFLNGLLTSVCRQSLHLAPGLLLNAPQISGAGNGKGLIARAIGAIAYGIRPRPFTMGNDKHEMDKRLVAEVMEGAPIVFMDNLNGTLLRSSTLASLITERPAGVRILGRSQMVKLEHASFFVVTGNGLTISEDLARRFISSGLDAQCEDPEQRPFKPGFIEQIEQRRAELLTAALTVWRWGRQNKSLKSGTTLGSFESWGQWVRDPLLALGCKDPVERISEIKAKDPDRQKISEIYELWWEHHEDAPMKASELNEEIRTIIDPQGRGRQFVAKAVEDLTGTRQSGFVLTRQKGQGRKAVATYALKETPSKDTPPGDGEGHTPHPPHTRDDEEISTKSIASDDDESGYASGMPGGCQGHAGGHTQGISLDSVLETEAVSMASDQAEGMGGMRGMPPSTAAKAIICAQCHGPPDARDPTAMHRIGDPLVRLHAVCKPHYERQAKQAGVRPIHSPAVTLGSSDSPDDLAL
jgi:hypothetical protein